MLKTIELSFEEYHDIISESEIENNFFSKMERDTTTEMVLETNSQKGYSYHELKNKAEELKSQAESKYNEYKSDAETKMADLKEKAEEKIDEVKAEYQNS